MTKLRQRNLNKSGIQPAANRVLIEPDPIEKPKDSLIEIPENVQERYEQGQASGTVIALGPDAFIHVVERVFHCHGNGERELIEERVRGYSEAFADVGDRVAYAKYVGRRVIGEDGVKYRIINDEDITAVISGNVTFTDLDTRKPLGNQ